jgi:hypothetical protein
MEAEEFMVILFIAVLAIKAFFIKDFIKIKEGIFQTAQIIQALTQNHITQVILIIILSELIIYFLYKGISRKIKQTKLKNREIRREKEFIQSFLNKDLKELNSDELTELVYQMENRRFLEDAIKDFRQEIKNKLYKANKRLIELDHEERIRAIKFEEEQLEEDIEKLKRKQYELEIKQRENQQRILKELDTIENPIFEKSKLEKEEIEALLKEGYKQTNEYCPIQQKIITVLVEPVLNHSQTHTFLCHSIRKLLEQYPEIKEIQEHFTKDADLTFRINNKRYALEIETGILLRKKKQLQEKVRYLNRKYKDRWMFIVSNRNLVKKYKKFGSCIQRKQVQEKIEKLIDF